MFSQEISSVMRCVEGSAVLLKPKIVEISRLSFLKKYGLMIPPAHKPHLTVDFLDEMAALESLQVLIATTLLDYIPIEPEMDVNA